MHEPILFDLIDSPIGPLLLTSNGRALTGVYMDAHQRGPRPGDGWRRDAQALHAVRLQLQAYFGRELFAFDLPLAPPGTEFQQRVWRVLRTIPYAETISYGEQARRLGNAAAARAVGVANGRNPISIVVPCHRVIGADGSLTGYGGGLPRKQWLLAHERGD